MKKVLFDKSPLVVDTVLATQIGLNEAIVLQQVHYWIEVNKAKQTNFYEGSYWTYNSMKEWSKSFPFFGEKTLNRIFKNLEKLEILKTGNFNKLRMDRTKWYTIDYSKLESYINEIEANENEKENECPEEEDASGQIDQMHLPKKENANGQNDQMEEDKITECNGSKCPNAIGQNDLTNTRDFTKTSSETYSETSSSSLKDVVEFFQSNFYLLKAFEAEVLKDWVDHYQADLVIAAMKVARKNNARSMAYIERVLENWVNDGITNINVLETYLREREERKNGQHSASIEPDKYDGLGLKMSDLQ